MHRFSLVDVVPPDGSASPRPSLYRLRFARESEVDRAAAVCDVRSPLLEAVRVELPALETEREPRHDEQMLVVIVTFLRVRLFAE